MELLEISEFCRFEHGADLKLVEGIQRNKTLENLTIFESSLSTVAMSSIIRGLSDGKVPKLSTLYVDLKHESTCTHLLTKLMSSDTCQLKNLLIESPSMFRTNGVRANRKLKSLEILGGWFDDSYLASVLPMMPKLLHLGLMDCELSGITPIINHLRHPSAAIRSISL